MSLRQRLSTLAPGTIITVAGVGYRDQVAAKESDAGWPLGVAKLAEGSNGGEQKSLLDDLSQPLCLLKEIERTVDLERDLYELEETRY